MSRQPIKDSPPPILYKYLPPERIDILENLELRFSRPTEFNDTFDTHYLTPQGMLRASAHRRRFRSALGVFCLTESPDDHLMWVHYARNHTGLVIGFDARAQFFSENDRVLRQVTYHRRPLVVPNADLGVCFRKSDVWKHEKEWRCVRSFEKTEPRNVSIDKALIKQIIFGFQMENWQITRTLIAATDWNMNVEYMFSKRSKKSWTFLNEPCTVTLCEGCDGDGFNVKYSRTPTKP